MMGNSKHIQGVSKKPSFNKYGYGGYDVSILLVYYFFWSFLSKTKRVWPLGGHIHGEFFLFALQLALSNTLQWF